MNNIYEMEELLNKLIEKGWKPFGYENVYIETYDESTPHGYVILRGKKYGTYEVVQNFRPYRFICTKESLLWQFVCENRMVENKYKDRRYYNENKQLKKACFDDGYEYRLIESALKDESELEQFLLDNIKVDE